MKKTIITLFIIGVSIINVLIIQSCEKDNSYFPDYEYLDMDVFNHTRSITEEELGIITKAFIRLENHISFDKGKVIVNTNHSDMNMSERLFNYLMLSDFSVNALKGPARLRYGGAECESGVGYTRCEISFDHNEITRLMNTMQSNYSNVGFGATMSGLFPGATSTFLSVLLGSKMYLEGLQWSSLERQYLNSGSTTGAKLVELTTFSSTTGMSYTVRRLQF